MPKVKDKGIENEECCVCNEPYVEHPWICEKCSKFHHPKCAGESFGGTSNENSNADEDAESICKNCIKIENDYGQ